MSFASFASFALFALFASFALFTLLTYSEDFFSMVAEEALVEKMLKAIGQNMDNLDYTVDQMASDIGMSRANLYKKTQQMLGITPNEFLRNVRLKHAAKLLSETTEPVNQISLMVGFQTSRYFSQCFQQIFGVTPTEYRSGKKQTEE